MIVRTYGRRNRGLTRTFSDSLNDDVSDSPPLSQETLPSQDIYDFPFTTTQESSSLWPSSQEFIDDDYKNKIKASVKPTQRSFELEDPRNGVVRRSKKQKQNQSKNEVGYSSMPWISPTSSLMEAQEFGEMMEHVDEVNFALDGLKKGQPVRIRRASLLSLLSICATAQQRRLLRTHGYVEILDGFLVFRMAKTIIDAILGLNFDDIPSNLAAVALFYVFTNDGQDDQLLESPCCIRFLMKILKPIIPPAKENKTEKVGFKLLALRKDANVSRDTIKVLDSSSAAIISKVEEILVSCKEMKSRCRDDSDVRRPELSPKWIALLTLEKACLSRISIEDATGTVRKTGGDFKEKLRELGGLDAVFEVAMECHSVMEGWVEQSLSSPLTEDRKDVQSLVLLSKCLKIMENAAFLSSENQSSCGSSSIGKACGNSKAVGGVDEFALTTDCKVDGHDIICISSSEKSSSMEWSSEKSSNTSQIEPGPSTQWLGHLVPSFQSENTSTNDSRLLKMRTRSSFASSCSGKLGNSYDEIPVTSNWSGILSERPVGSKDDKWQVLEDSQDPFAFDEEEFVPSKWDLLSGSKKTSQTKKHRKLGPRNREIQIEHQCHTISQKELTSEEICLRKSTNEEYNHSNAASSSKYGEEEYASLLSDCLLAAVKVLMNLTNGNPLGCKQIAASGALETLSTLIACHFPSFCSYLPRISEMEENSLRVELHNQNDRPLTDPELDFLVAILGLLVNLVEKDEHNRSRLAAASVSLPDSEGLNEGSHMAVIPLLCAIFLANQGEDDGTGILSWNDEAAMLQEEKEAEKMILEAYAALLLAFLSTESKSTRNAIAECLPNHSLSILVPVLERFVAFHFTLNMISSETHKAVSEVIESCRIP
ncbi:hypothetical protein Gotri_025691 [Gossypium trilobum]|uniref:Wings apart-like protein C-terminal domain-containing protein n=1 Tax=Gossypium trilobum TaxID=34281 RepID=A0A7J9FXS8_9ROSI|nr:hypothetical protein [Gossypium trilobum]